MASDHGAAAPRNSLQRILALGFCLALVFAVSALGSLATFPKILTWYASLAKPWFNPPASVFGPVWTFLYLLMAVAAWRVWLRPASAARRTALTWFSIQLALNAVWSPIFFGLEQPRIAFAVIVVLVLAIAATFIRSLAVDRLAAWMLIPYLTWVAFATVLNGAIVALN